MTAMQQKPMGFNVKDYNDKTVRETYIKALHNQCHDHDVKIYNNILYGVCAYKNRCPLEKVGRLTNITAIKLGEGNQTRRLDEVFVQLMGLLCLTTPPLRGHPTFWQ